VESELKLLLCEGKHEVDMLSRLIEEAYEAVEAEEKEKTIRRIYQRQIGSEVLVIINEKGKERLHRNAALLLSKLRSIWYERRIKGISVVLIVDADSDSGEGYVNRLFGDLQSMINDPRRFPKQSRPHIDPDSPIRIGSYFYRISLTYPGSGVLNIYVFTIPYNLEHWVDEKGYNTFNKLCGLPWFREMLRMLSNDLKICVRGFHEIGGQKPY